MDKNQLAVEAFDLRAGLYQEKFMDVGLYHVSLDLFCQLVAPVGAELLELACGPGNVTRYLLEKRPDLRILGTDLSPNMIELATRNNPAATFQLLDCRAPLSLGRRFDAILCGFGLPYLTREEAVQLIADAATALRPGGVLYLSTMEDDYAKSGPRSSSQGDVLYMYFHQADYLSEAIAGQGLIVKHLERITYGQQPDCLTTDLVLVAQKPV